MGSGSSSSQSRFLMTPQDVIDECSGTSNVEHAHVLVTGATSGIGIETAQALAVAGANVYVMGRNENKAREVIRMINRKIQENSSRGSVKAVLFDLNSLANIKEFADKFIQEKFPLNILILNAGVFNTKFTQTVDGIEQVMGVNHIAHAYLTKLLMPVLINNAPSRIVVVSSKMHSGPPLNYRALERMSSKINDAKNGWTMERSYQQSKLANMLYARALAMRYKKKRVTVYSLHPGVIDTNLTSDTALLGLLQAVGGKKTTEQGAATSVYCALNPNIENETGRYFENSTVTDLAEKWSDDDVNTLWEWTDKMIYERTDKFQ